MSSSSDAVDILFTHEEEEEEVESEEMPPFDPISLQVKIHDLDPVYKDNSYTLPVYISKPGVYGSNINTAPVSRKIKDFDRIRASVADYLDKNWDFRVFSKVVMQLRVPRLPEVPHVRDRVDLLKSFVQCYVISNSTFKADYNHTIFHSFMRVWTEVILLNTAILTGIFDRYNNIVCHTSIGTGTAIYKLNSDKYTDIRAELLNEFASLLSPANSIMTELLNRYHSFKKNEQIRHNIANLIKNGDAKTSKDRRKRERINSSNARRMIPHEGFDVKQSSMYPSRLASLTYELYCSSDTSNALDYEGGSSYNNDDGDNDYPSRFRVEFQQATERARDEARLRVQAQEQREFDNNDELDD